VRHLRIPIWREGRVPLEHAALLRNPVLRGEGVPRGDGGPVLLVPGFLAGDPSLGTMAGWLKRLGYRPSRARMRANVDCETRSLDRLEASLEALTERHGRKAAVVGQSRGGTMARGLALRRPDLVSTVVALGSPMTDQFAVHPLVRAQVTALGALGTFGVPGLIGRGCTHGACCEETRARLGEPFPEDVRFVSVYSRSDGIVDWRSCLDPAAEHVEVSSSHIGMAVHPDVFRAVARALAPRAEGSLRAAA
jgi:pimeloyl-ACP methyl ester carboxylesterase